MKIRYGKILILLASITVGVLLGSNLEYLEKLNIGSDDSKEYLDQVIEKNSLLNEITKLEGENKNAQRKLYTYTAGNTEEKVEDELREEIEKNKLESGYESVKGEGIEIILNDAENILVDGNYISGNNIHNYDVYHVINELRNFGAEAISVNGIRVFYDTEVYCYGSEILINDISITVPFRISAIGDKEKLYSAITAPESYYGVIKALRQDLRLSIKKSDEIIIQGSYKEKELKYINSK